jgi:hypothetical protein
MQAFHVKAPVRRINAKDLKSRVPRPRFWGNPQVDHYDLQRLRSAIVEIGLDPSKSPEFPGAGKEVADANSSAAFAKFRRDTETFWKLATELNSATQVAPLEWLSSALRHTMRVSESCCRTLMRMGKQTGT